MTRTRWIGAIVITIAVVGLAAILGARRRPAPNVSATVPVTVPVTRGDVSQTVLAPGQVVATREAVLNAPADGTLLRPVVRAGEQVGANQALAYVANADGQSLPVTAPFAGVILELIGREGERVTAGQPLLLIADPTALEVEATVVEEELPLLSIGQPVTLFFDPLPDREISGRLDRIVPRRTPGANRPLYTIYITLDRPVAGLLAGMTADAEIIIAAVDDVLRLPRALVRSEGNSTTVVDIWRDNQRVSRQVVLGLRGDVYIAVLDGLHEGDLVIAEVGS